MAAILIMHSSFSIFYVCCLILHIISFCFSAVHNIQHFYSSCISLSLFKISIGISGSKTLPENTLSDIKCSFHGQKIDVRLVSPMCWRISSLYFLLLIIFIIFHSPAFFKFNDFFDTFSEKKCLAFTQIHCQSNTLDVTNNFD